MSLPTKVIPVSFAWMMLVAPSFESFFISHLTANSEELRFSVHSILTEFRNPMMASAIRIQRIMLMIIVEYFLEIKRVDSTPVKSSLESDSPNP